jgi:hypothetical protein
VTGSPETLPKYFIKIAEEKSNPIFWGATSVIKKLPKVKTFPIGGNSPNLVTLQTTGQESAISQVNKMANEKGYLEVPCGMVFMYVCT